MQTKVWVRLSGFWLAFLAATVVGCSGTMALEPVEGKVLYKGSEIKGALVTFHPVEGNAVTIVRPTGFTDDAGVFKLSTDQAPGARAGAYVVTIICPRDMPAGKEGASGTGTSIESYDLFEGVYADPSKSTLKVTIPVGGAKFDPFHLQ